MSCGTLTTGFARNCANPVIGGVTAEVILFNYEDWIDGTISITGSDVTSISLATGVVGYKVESINNQIRPKAEQSRENGIIRYTHSIGVVIDGDDVAAKDFINTLEKGLYVGIVFTKSRQIEVYGNGAGLEVAGDGKRDRYENDGRMVLTLSSNEASLETRESLNYTGTASPYDFATAKAEIEALLA